MKKLYKIILLILCWNLTCLYIYKTLNNLERKTQELEKIRLESMFKVINVREENKVLNQVTKHIDIISQLRADALREVGYYGINNHITFEFPILPKWGHIDCLNRSSAVSQTLNQAMVYIGSEEGACEGCVVLNISDSFTYLSTMACRSSAMYCGTDSTFLCGLLAVSTRTVLYVKPAELHTWPEYMQDYGYGKLTLHETERNYRLYLDRHTIQESRLLILDTINKLKIEALEEVGLDRTSNEISCEFPIIPIKGYRNCLNGSDIISRVRSGPTYYMGVEHGACKGCVLLNNMQSFSSLSTIVCRSTALYCGLGSTFLCGLISLSTKTVTYVNEEEFLSWPQYMKDFSYGNSAVGGLERNHRLVFDRHTIKQSHQKLLKKINSDVKIQGGYNLIVYTREDECNNETDKHSPLPRGNMGDVFGTNLATYFGKKIKTHYSIICYDTLTTNENFYNVTLALVGSIAQRALQTPNVILLGVGTIQQGELENDNTTVLVGANVIGVRGPRSRDAFLSKYGVNPEIVQDPGLYVMQVFEEEIEEARRDDRNMKDICFISHEVEEADFYFRFYEYQDVTISSNGDVREIIKFIATCRFVVSSGLHGIIFSHALSIPVAAIRVSNKLGGGDWKFFDYYYGINVTNFKGRLDFEDHTPPQSKEEWIHIVKKFPQPSFPINTNTLRTFEIFKTIFQNV